MSRDSNRAAFPAFAEALDAIKATLPNPGDVRVLYVEEGGRHVGRLPEEEPAPPVYPKKEPTIKRWAHEDAENTDGPPYFRRKGHAA